MNVPFLRSLRRLSHRLSGAERLSAASRLWRTWYEEILQRTYAPHLTPLRQLRASETTEHQWHSLGDRPEFCIEPPLPGGWVRLRLKGRARPPALVTLYLDRGEDQAESRALRLGVLNPSGTLIERFVSFRNARSARLDPSVGPGYFTIDEFVFQRVGLWRVILHAVATYLDRDQKQSFWRLVRRAAAILRTSGLSGLRRTVVSRIVHGRGSASPYDVWLEQDWLDDEAKRVLRSAVDACPYRPTLSLIVAVHDPKVWQLTTFLDSIGVQLYPQWELCLAYDTSTPAEIRFVLEQYASEDSRVKVVHPAPERDNAPPLSAALSQVTGEFIAIVGQDDELSQDALLRFVLLLNEHRDADLIYSDEDRMDDAGVRSSPYFKPDWSPETLLGDMYLGRLCVYRRSVVEHVGAFSGGTDAGAEYDLALRVTEKTDRIHHIHRVLCHRRTTRKESDTAEQRAAGGDDHATLEALRRAMTRRGLRGSVEVHERFPDHHVVRLGPDLVQKVSIVIPTRDRADLLERCLDTVFALTRHPNFEVCVVDNGSKEAATFEVLERFKRLQPERFQVIRRDVPFNFSALVNAGVAVTTGELLVLLNNDTEVRDGSWLEELAGYAQRPDIGAVGCVLQYANDTVQHGGVILVAGAVAAHSHVGEPATAAGYFGRLLAQSNYAAVTAACLMVRRDVFVEAGAFDEQLPVAYNDVDFCLRLLQLGYRNVCLGQVRLLHHESLSRGSDDAAEARERTSAAFGLMRARWASLLDRDPYYNPNLRGAPPDFSPARSSPASVGSSGPAATGEARPELPQATSAPRWVGASSPALLVAGHSHRLAFIDYLNRSGQTAPIAVLDSASSIDAENNPYWARALAAARNRRLPLLIVWVGNQHNAHFLLESEDRFAVFPATGPWDDGFPRPLVPRALIHEFFAPSFAPLRALLTKAAGVKVIVLGTPPPKSDDQIRASIHDEPWLAEWAGKLGMTVASLRITPLPVRVELWKITQELLRACSDEFGATFVEVPERALSGGGALHPDASAADTTHANGLWAEIMVQEATQALAAR